MTGPSKFNSASISTRGLRRFAAHLPTWNALRLYRYYKSPTLREPPTSRIRGLNIKGPGARPRGRGIWRPQENKTQPTSTASTGGKKIMYGRNAQKYQKYSVGKRPSGARRNRKHRWFKPWLYRFNYLVACRSLKPPGTARNGRKRPCLACLWCRRP